MFASSVPHASASEESDTHPGFVIKWSGLLKTVHRKGDASPRINLHDVEGPAGLFAIGPLAGLRGEITVIDGTPYIARVEGDTIIISHGFDVEAPFLVYGNVDRWKAVPVPEGIRTIPELEKWLPGVAKDAGIDPETEAFPFKLATSASDIKYHVISNTEPGYHVSRPHEELMIRFTSHSEPVTMLGVFSKNAGGVFTHMGQWTHIHVAGGDGGFAGHVDSFELGPDAVLYLPGD